MIRKVAAPAFLTFKSSIKPKESTAQMTSVTNSFLSFSINKINLYLNIKAYIEYLKRIGIKVDTKLTIGYYDALCEGTHIKFTKDIP